MPAEESKQEERQEQTYRSRILKTYFIRFHMSLILLSVVATGVLSSRLLLHWGIVSMVLRYPLAVLISYVVFLLLVRIWIWWVSSAQLAIDLSLLNNANGGFGGWGSSGSGSDVRFGGGSSGGGGASSSWEGMQPMPISQGGGSSAVSGKASGGWLSDLGGVDGDDWWILLLLAVLVGSILCAGGYLVYAAPQFLPEAAWQAALAHGLHRMTKRKPDWMAGVIRASVLPFIAVMLAALALGWQAGKYCPGASRLAEVFSCAVQPETPQ